MIFFPLQSPDCTNWDKNWSFVPKNVHLVPKNGKICTFYTKNEVFVKKISPDCTNWG